MNVDYDAIIVGAGISGCATALGLAASGARVLLADKATFPRSKVCGGCLNARAVAALRGLIGSHRFDELGAVPLGLAVFQNPYRRASVPFQNPPGFGPMAVSRYRLDEILLLECRRRGVEVWEATRAVSSTAHGDSREVCLRRSDGTAHSPRARMVFACDGLGSRIAEEARLTFALADTPRRLIGVGMLLPPGAFGLPSGQITMALGNGGYVGLVMVEDSQWDVAAALSPEAIRAAGGSESAIRSVLQRANIPINTMGSAPVLGCPPLNRTARRRWADRLLLVGDAAGYIEPVTGEGMAWALASADAAVEATGSGWQADTGARYERLWQQRVGARTRMVRGVSWMLRHPSLTDGALAILALAPRLSAFIGAGLNEQQRGINA